MQHGRLALLQNPLKKGRITVVLGRTGELGEIALQLRGGNFHVKPINKVVTPLRV